MKAKKGKYKLIEQLIADGFRYIFGNPGTVEEGFLDAMSDYPDIEYITCLHESVAVAMADGYSRKSGKPALVQLHSSVGLGNGVGMMYQANRGHAPLVVLAGDAGIRYDSMDAQMACNLVEMAKPVTKWAGRVVDKQSLLRIIRKAIKIARTPPEGVVFVELPMDILDEINDEPVFKTPRVLTDTAPQDETIQNIVTNMLNAKSPIFIIGDGVSFADAKEELESVAYKVCPKVYGADNSLINFDQTSSLYQGDLGHMFGESSRKKVADADFVLIVGTYVFPEVFPDLRCPFSEQAIIVHIDLNAYEIAKNHRVDIGVNANPKYTLAKIDDMLTLPSKRDIIVKKDSKSDIRGSVFSDFMRELKAKAPDDIIIFDEALTASSYISGFFPKSREGELFATRGGSLGVGIPGAMGIKLFSPEKTVIGFSGDGGSMYTIQALYTAARYKIGAKFVICDNKKYKLLEDNILRYWKDESIPIHNVPDCLELGNIDFSVLSKSLGVAAASISETKHVKPIVKRMLESNREPFLVVVDLD
ncbi:MAG: thiamine pyrophosphate-binding protein [Clostridiales bacterium]|jgi:benzoylformate decarboxylase|nr:thiamine pyrophosphate-binding protein [Clostridiales bacterium]